MSHLGALGRKRRCHSSPNYHGIRGRPGTRSPGRHREGQGQPKKDYRSPAPPRPPTADVARADNGRDRAQGREFPDRRIFAGDSSNAGVVIGDQIKQFGVTSSGHSNDRAAAHSGGDVRTQWRPGQSLNVIGSRVRLAGALGRNRRRRRFERGHGKSAGSRRSAGCCECGATGTSSPLSAFIGPRRRECSGRRTGSFWLRECVRVRWR